MSIDLLSTKQSKQRNQNAKYRNPELEKVIQSADVGSFFSYEHQQLNELDMPILIDQAIVGKEIEALELTHNEINEKGVELLANALENNRTLKELRIGGDPLESCVNSLARCLHSNKALELLHLEDVGINDDGAQSLAEMLENNETLITLSLIRNNITAKGVQRFAQALHGNSNSTLQKLDLTQNDIDDTCINDLIYMFRYNNVLKELVLERSQLSNDGIIKLENAAARKKYFKLSIDGELGEGEEEC